jgi:adiponectin receptor
VSVLVTRIHFLSLILLLWGANVPLIYYGFFCDLVLQIAYWAVTSAIALVCSAFSLFPIGYVERHPQLFKVATCASLASSIIAPLVHGLVAHGLPDQVPRLDLQWLIYALIVLTVGFAAHALKVRSLQGAIWCSPGANIQE